MGLLAQSRRKEKWAYDPQNKNWVDDKKKFGMKMMQKMGWAEGQGLGVNGVGSTEHVKVFKKQDTLGVGAKTNHGDNWLAHQDAFSALLASLNENMQNDVDAKADEEKAKETEKKETKRLFYSKFQKAKDVSRYSSVDLAQIFGKKKKDKDEESEEEETSSSSNQIADGIQVNVRTENVKDYFQQLMAKRGGQFTMTTRRVVDDYEDEMDGDRPSFGGAAASSDHHHHHHKHTHIEQTTSTFSLAKFSKAAVQLQTIEVEEKVETVSSSDSEEEEEEKKKKKEKKEKKKKKKEKEQEEEVEIEKKDKSKKRKKEEEEEASE
eukprot:Colp12_sorted_trinity150504_noHs@10932